MIEFKKRLRILAADESCEMNYLNDGGIRFTTKDDAVLQCNPKTQRFMTCSVLDQKGAFSFDIQKEFVFDVFLRFCKPGLRTSLKNYRPGALLTLQNYIDEEQGQEALDSLRSKVLASPDIRDTLGGNRILVEYRLGMLVIVDDLMRDSANVVEFTSAIW
ncbi:MAG: hypothetical protein K8T91_22435 [Planctomycetes bacterium]|nr:hypothetical protein [Planctomycetota bacterium]